MNAKQIDEFLSTLDKSRRRLRADELETLYALANHPNPLIRSDVAALLLDHYEEKSEEVLLRLSLDPDAGVRADAADSLCIGRKEPVLKRLLNMAATDPEYMVRGFAVHSAYDVFLNMLGDSDSTHTMIVNILTPLLDQEQAQWVRICFYCVLYLCGKREYLQQLQDCLEDDDYYVRNAVLETFEDILDEENELEIEEAIQYHLPFEESPELSNKMEELLLYIGEQNNQIW